MDITSGLDAFPSEVEAPRAVIRTPAADAPRASSSALVKLTWAVSLMGGIAAAAFASVTVSLAGTNDRQAAAAALACALALIPYVIARSMQELAR